MANPPDLIDFSATFDGRYGLEILSCTETEITGQVGVSERVMQPYGLVHGGVYASMAEALASIATALVVHQDGEIAVGLSNNTSFLRPIKEGTVHAVGKRRHRGRSTWIWDVDFTDDAGRLCATSRMTIAVRSMP